MCDHDHRQNTGPEGVPERSGERSRGRPARAAPRFLAGLWAVAVIALAGGCGGGSTRGEASPASRRAELAGYLRQIEPVRLKVNSLLEGADPILSGYRDGRLSPMRAWRRMDALERRFASYAVDVAAVQPSSPELLSLQRIYAHTYVLEDAYLSALATGLAARRLDRLPNTQASQRAAIIQWRIGLEVIARRVALVLPADLQAAGRGEIAPSPGGS